MITYYNFRVGFYKTDSDSKSFTHINDAEDASSISLITNEIAFDKLITATIDNVGGEWQVISEEEFNVVKESVLNKITTS